MNKVILINQGKIKFKKLTDNDLLTLIEVARNNNYRYQILHELNNEKKSVTMWTIFYSN